VFSIIEHAFILCDFFAPIHLGISPLIRRLIGFELVHRISLQCSPINHTSSFLPAHRERFDQFRLVSQFLHFRISLIRIYNVEPLNNGMVLL
jgi:hypothetical protein